VRTATTDTCSLAVPRRLFTFCLFVSLRNRPQATLFSRHWRQLRRRVCAIVAGGAAGQQGPAKLVAARKICDADGAARRGELPCALACAATAVVLLHLQGSRAHITVVNSQGQSVNSMHQVLIEVN
jgi:hypothetical protein